MSRRPLCTTLIAVVTCAAFAAFASPFADAATSVGNVAAGKAPQTLPPPNPVSPVIFTPPSLTVPPPGFGLNARGAVAVGDRTEAVRKTRAHHPGLRGVAYISPLPLRSGVFYHWDVVYRARGEPLVEVEMTPTGKVLETQTAPDVGWTLLRGYPGVLGGKLNAPYIWLPLCLLFVAPFFDPRRIFRLLHLDLLMLLAFGISQYFFAAGRPDVSVPLVYPFLIYFLVRMVVAALRPTRRRGDLVPFASTHFLIGGIVVLMALRIAFGFTDSHTFDISQAGVIGADRIQHGLPLYVENDSHGDTYGPVNYLAYVPFELAFPYHYKAGGVTAARPATLSFDMLTLVGLFLLGRRLRRGSQGTRLGAALAYAWVAFPYTALVIASNTNDTLVPLFLVYALLVAHSPPGRGLFAAIAGMTKFAPLLVAPSLVVGRGAVNWRRIGVAATVFALFIVGIVWAFLPDGGVGEFWRTTLGFQLKRTSPLSIWVRDPSLDWLRRVFEVIGVAFAVGFAFVPRRRTVGQLAAICAAVLVAGQIPTNYWIYFYLVWFAPFVLIALFEEYRNLGPRSAEDQGRVMSALLKDVRISRPASVT